METVDVVVTLSRHWVQCKGAQWEAPPNQQQYTAQHPRESAYRALNTHSVLSNAPWMRHINEQ